MSTSWKGCAGGGTNWHTEPSQVGVNGICVCWPRILSVWYFVHAGGREIEPFFSDCQILTKILLYSIVLDSHYNNCFVLLLSLCIIIITYVNAGRGYVMGSKDITRLTALED